MIEKALLPMRLVHSEMQQSVANYRAQRLNPLGNPAHGKSRKQMDVIGQHSKGAPRQSEAATTIHDRNGVTMRRSQRNQIGSARAIGGSASPKPMSIAKGARYQGVKPHHQTR
jgi:hypothetical protein